MLVSFCKETDMKKKITWLLFHEPAELFIRTAEHFEQEVNARTGDAYEFEILELGDYEAKYYDGKRCDPLAELRSGRVQMSQIYINTLAHANVNNFLALTLPYLFRDHAHATRVFEGELGAELLDHVQDSIGIKGLSFTYSGGFKCMAVNRPVHSVDDFSGLTHDAKISSVRADMFAALGSTPVDGGEGDYKDTTLPRYGADASKDQTYAIKTDHAMYLTTILANKDLMDCMSESHYEAFKQAAKTAAHAERIKSVQDADEISVTPSLQRSLNISQVIELDAAQHAKLREKLEPVREKWRGYFPNALVDRIQAC